MRRRSFKQKPSGAFGRDKAQEALGPVAGAAQIPARTPESSEGTEPSRFRAEITGDLHDIQGMVAWCAPSGYMTSLAKEIIIKLQNLGGSVVLDNWGLSEQDSLHLINDMQAESVMYLLVEIMADG